MRSRPVQVWATTFVALVAWALPGAPAQAAATYVRTIGHAGHEAMYPSGIDVDGTGNVYVADTGNDQVAAYAPAGGQLWRVGSRGSKANGSFSNPRDVAYLAGKLYVADTEYNRVQVLNASNGAWLATWSYRFTSIIGISAGVDAQGHAIILTSQDVAPDSATGYVQTFTTSGSPIKKIGAGTLNAPRDAATDAAGNVYVADYAHDRIVEFTPAGGLVRAWGTHGSANGQFLRPYGVDLDAAGHVYVADSDNNRIQEFSATGGFLKKWGPTSGSGQLFQLRRVAVGAGSSPKVYAADLWGWKVVRYLQGGSVDHVYPGTGTTAPAPPPNGGFNEPSGLTVNPATNLLYVADAVNQRVQYFNATTGAFAGTWGQRGWGNGSRNGFNWPRDVAFDGPSQYIWVADTKNNRLTAFAAANPGAGPAVSLGVIGSGVDQTHWPFAVVAVPGSKDIVVADTFNNRVERWHYNGTTWTTSGTGGWVSTAAGGLGYATPLDVAVLGSNVYVADANNHRVVELSLATGAFVKSLTGGGQLHNPQGVAVEANGDVWVSDNSYNRIVEVDASGAFVQAVGGPHAGSGDTSFSSPRHLEIYNGNLYVADTYNDRVQVYTNL